MAQNASPAGFPSVLEFANDQHPSKDYVVRKNGLVYAGTHILLDFWGARGIDDPETVTQALRDAAEACNATVLHVHVHEFLASGGVSGVAVLAESHITVHSWPEIDYAAFDVFMCGACDPMLAVPVLRRAFRPDRVTVDEQKRGLIG
jgi:S-adenosylmethionine decarboxylase